MTTYRQIVAATDLSPRSLLAVDRGFMIARRSGARLTIVHALPLDTLGEIKSMLGAHASALSERIAADAREALTTIAQDPAHAHGVAAHTHLAEGLPGSVVPAYAEGIGADLVILGAHGKGFVRRLLLGSTASHLLRKSRCPVLVVKRAPRRPYRRLLVAVDFSPGSALALAAARRLAPDAEIVLFHAFEVPFEAKMEFAGIEADVIRHYRTEARARAMERLHATAAAAGLAEHEHSALVVRGDSHHEVLAQAVRSGCDLIVMGKHGTHVTEELLLGSVTKRVLAESACDVLVVIDDRAAPPL